MVTMNLPMAAEAAAGVPYVTANESYRLMSVELERLFALLDRLDGADWSRPTACTMWNVREIIAHQAGGYASGTGYREFFRQAMAKRQPGQLPEDAINNLQVSERAGKSPEVLIAELRRAAPEAARNWAYGFRLAKLLAIPHPLPGILTMRYLMWVIHSRDTWMHRLDICRATGHAFEQSAEHDGRIVALILRDVETALGKKLGGRAIVFDLSGIAGGVWKIGSGEVAATIQMDALDFCIFASGRLSYEEARARAGLSGDIPLAETALRNILILF